MVSLSTLVLVMASLFAVGLASAVRSAITDKQLRLGLIAAAVSSFSILLVLGVEVVRVAFLTLPSLGEEEGLLPWLVPIGGVVSLGGLGVLAYGPLMKATE
jgi:hypothetical protein